jgi:hypothetical protein
LAIGFGERQRDLAVVRRLEEYLAVEEGLVHMQMRSAGSCRPSRIDAGGTGSFR